MPLSNHRNKHIQRTLVEAAELTRGQSHELTMIYGSGKSKKETAIRTTLRRSPEDGCLYCFPSIRNKENLSPTEGRRTTTVIGR